MKICVLQSSYEGSNSPFKEVDPYSDVSVWLPEHEVEKVLVQKATAVQQVRDLVKKGFDLFINLCDGGFDEDRAGIEVVQALERYNVPYTGASSTFYEPTKQEMKMVAQYCGVRTPAFVFAHDDESTEMAVESLTFPLIVKHFNGSGSIGMTKNSRVENKEQLFIQAQKMIGEFGGALIEEFIEGREFTVLIAENPKDETDPIALMPVECIFGGGETFKHFDLKWIDHDTMRWIACEDQELSEKLKAMSKRIFVGLKGVSYGRTDIRVNKEGQPFFLEMNPNCGIFYPKDDAGSADFILYNDPQTDHKQFLSHIISCAIKRHKNRHVKYEVRWTKKLGYGLYAKETIEDGEEIIQNEGKPHYLVTKSEAENWSDPGKLAWFKACGYPISDEVFIIWGDSPSEWKPINHSCNPNAGFKGLNVYARRKISKHEQISLDYATFCAENSEEFKCLCGSSNCRGTIRGDDYHSKWVFENHRQFLSPYIKSRHEGKAGGALKNQ